MDTARKGPGQHGKNTRTDYAAACTWPAVARSLCQVFRDFSRFLEFVARRRLGAVGERAKAKYRANCSGFNIFLC